MSTNIRIDNSDILKGPTNVYNNCAMRIVVVGAGVSGIIFSINRKRLHPEDHIVIFEHLDKPLKKILATGNGILAGTINFNFAYYGTWKNVYRRKR